MKAHGQWQQDLNKKKFAELIKSGDYLEIASRAVKIESPTNLLFSFEKMALCDAVRSPAGAQTFAEGLFAYLHGSGKPENRFERRRQAVAAVPKKQSRIPTYRVLTVFPYLAQPAKYIFLKPLVTRRAAERYGFDFDYQSPPASQTYRVACWNLRRSSGAISKI